MKWYRGKDISKHKEAWTSLDGKKGRRLLLISPEGQLSCGAYVAEKTSFHYDCLALEGELFSGYWDDAEYFAVIQVPKKTK